MCNCRYYDAVSVAISILVGIVLGVLGLLGLLVAGAVAPLLGALLAAVSLLLLTLLAISPLRQAAAFAACLCQKGLRLLVGALLLLVVSSFALIFAIATPIATLIITFLIFTFFAYTLFSLYCLLRCAVRAGCGADPASCVIRL